MKLADWLDQRGMSAAHFGKLVGVTRITVWRLASEKALPGLELAVAIERATRGRVRPKDFLSAQPTKEE